MRRWWWIGIGLLLLGDVQIASARQALADSRCTIAANQVIAGDLFLLCREIVLDGQIEGNVFAATVSIQVNGDVRGSLYTSAVQQTINGRIGGNVHFLGGSVALTDQAAFDSPRASLVSIAASTQIEGEGLAGSILGIGYQIVAAAAIGGDMTFIGSAITVGDAVGGTVTAQLGQPSASEVFALGTILRLFGIDTPLNTPGLIIAETAQIAGDLRYSSATGGQIDGAIAGAIVYDPAPTQPTFAIDLETPQTVGDALFDYASAVLREFISLALVGAIIGVFLSPALRGGTREVLARPLVSAGVGILTLIAALPISLVLLLASATIGVLLTLIGVTPLGGIVGVTLVLITSAVIGSFVFTALFVGRALIGLSIGRWIEQRVRVRRRSTLPDYAQLVIGAAVIAPLLALPTIGWWINILVICVGNGALILQALSPLRRPRQIVQTILGDTPPAPPLIDEPPKPLGMNNLPDGFRWWD